MAEERKILKPKDVKPSLIKRLEAAYGPVDMKNDFFSADLDTYFKTDEINPETNSVQHKIIKLASFGDSLEKMSSAVKALKIGMIAAAVIGSGLAIWGVISLFMV